MFNFLFGFGSSTQQPSAPKIGRPTLKGGNSSTDIINKLQTNPAVTVEAELNMLQSMVFNKDTTINWVGKITESCDIWTTQLQRDPSLKTRYHQQLLNILGEFACIINHLKEQQNSEQNPKQNFRQDLDRLVELYCTIGGDRKVIETRISDSLVIFSEQQAPAMSGHSNGQHEEEVPEQQSSAPKAATLNIDSLITQIVKGQLEVDKVDTMFQEMAQANNDLDSEAILKLVNAVVKTLEKNLKQASPENAIEKIKVLVAMLSNNRPLFETVQVASEVQQQVVKLLMFDAFTPGQDRATNNQQGRYFQELRKLVQASPWLEAFTKERIITKIDSCISKNTAVENNHISQSSMKFS